MPMEPFADELLACLEEARRDGVCRAAYHEEDAGQDNPSAARQSVRTEASAAAPVYLIGEAVISQSLARAVSESYGCRTKVLCPLETEKELLEEGLCLSVDSEEEIAEILADAAGIIADRSH